MAKLLIDGKWVAGTEVQTLRDRYADVEFGEMHVASVQQVEEAVTGAANTFRSGVLLADERYRILTRAAALINERAEELMRLITLETGFPNVDAKGEVARCVQTLQLSADESRRICGDMVPMEATPGLKNRLGYTILVPKGVVCAITPYNSPLNTVAHKVAPALAAGNAVVLKPSEYTPLTAVALCEVLLDAGLPAGWLSLLHGPGSTIGRALVADPRINFYTFTGSTAVGKEIQEGAGLRSTQLELGSMASTIVAADADLELALRKIAAASFRKAGQVCTSVQRVLVHRSVYDTFCSEFSAAAAQIPFGDPDDPKTVVGPMITLKQAERAESWVNSAVEDGATVLAGGRRHGTVYEPTVLVNVPATATLACNEVFAPLVSVVPFDELNEAYEQANSTPFGLAVGLFTRDVSTALKAPAVLQFGGIHINETSSSRVDVMPFGGVKDSGFGREGPRYAVREMLEERLVTISY